MKKERNPLYKLVSKEWHPIIDQHRKIMHVNKGDQIFSEGDEVKGIFFIVSGKVKIVSSAGTKDERVHRLAGDQKILGHRGFSAKLYPVAAIALTDSVLVFVPMEIFLLLIKTNPSLGIFIINLLADQLREAEQRTRDAVSFNVQQRIASVLKELVNAFGYDPQEKHKLAFTLSRKDFASMAGTTYETVIRTLKDFQKRKIVRLVGKTIHVLKIGELNKLVS